MSCYCRGSKNELTMDEVKRYMTSELEKVYLKLVFFCSNVLTFYCTTFINISLGHTVLSYLFVAFHSLKCENTFLLLFYYFRLLQFFILYISIESISYTTSLFSVKKKSALYFIRYIYIVLHIHYSNFLVSSGISLYLNRL